MENENRSYLEPFKDELVISNYTIYIDEDVQEPDYYRLVCEILRKASPDDSFTFIFSTNGGLESGMIALMSAMRSCPSLIHGILAGDAFSAGSALFLECDSFEVMPMSSMMIHTASYGIGGKHTDVSSYHKFNEDWIERFIDETYSDFLPKDRLDDVKNGRDVYIATDQVQEYLVSMCERRIARQTENMSEQLELDLKEETIQ